jgi:plasmid replication initiation protein
MALVLAQIQENENKLKPFYQMDVSDIMKAGEVGGKSAYQEAKKALDELARQIWSIEDVENEIYRPKQLINTSTLESKEGFEYGYKNGVITIVLNPALEPYFVELSHYSRYELKSYMKFKSWYSMRFWEILSAYQDTGKWMPSLEEYRKLMDCEKKYPLTKDLINKTTAEPLEELKGSELEFTVEKVFAKYHGKGRPPVIGLDFKLVKSLLNDDEILSEWAKHSPDHARMISKLHNDWKITQACLRKYLPEIKMEGARRLLRQFEQMESIGTKRKIDSKEKYCNSAIKKMAEEITKGK